MQKPSKIYKHCSHTLLSTVPVGSTHILTFTKNHFYQAVPAAATPAAPTFDIEGGAAGTP